MNTSPNQTLSSWAHPGRVSTALCSFVSLIHEVRTEPEHPEPVMREVMDFLFDVLEDIITYAEMPVEPDNQAAALHHVEELLTRLEAMFVMTSLPAARIQQIADEYLYGIFRDPALARHYSEQFTQKLASPHNRSVYPTVTGVMSPMAKLLAERISVSEETILEQMSALYYVLSYANMYTDMWNRATTVQRSHCVLSRLIVDATRRGSVSTVDALVSNELLWNSDLEHPEDLYAERLLGALEHLGTLEDTTTHDHALHVILHTLNQSIKAVDYPELIELASREGFAHQPVSLVSAMVSLDADKAFDDDPDSEVSIVYLSRMMAPVLE
jgi:hypothetical protein